MARATEVRETGCELGFAEDAQGPLTSPYFPSKIGGRPAWLGYEELPSPTCSCCEEPLSFLCQIYCGTFFSDKDEEYHRTHFLFICRKPECNRAGRAGGFAAFRAHLRCSNKWYEDQDIDRHADLSFKETPCASLCHVCGAGASKRCSKCKQVYYCHKSHQAWHWQHGHQHTCAAGGSKPIPWSKDMPTVLPEFEVIFENEFVSINEERSEEDRVADFKTKVKQLKVDTQQDSGVDDIERDMKKDKTLRLFRNRIKDEPTQIIRYHQNGKPVWIGDRVPSADEIRACDCGAPRTFEYQVMPQVLSHFASAYDQPLDTDFGVLAVFTCSANCGKSSYQEELVWHNQVNE